MKKQLILLVLIAFNVHVFAQTIHMELAPTRATSTSKLPYLAGKVKNETYVFASDISFNLKYPYMVLARHANLKKFDQNQKQIFSKDLLLPAAEYFIPLQLSDKICLIGVKNVAKTCVANIYTLTADGEVRLEKEIGKIADNPLTKQARFKAVVSEDRTKFMLIGAGFWEDANIPEGNGGFFVAVYDGNLNLIGSAYKELACSWAQFRILDFNILNNTNACIATLNPSTDEKNKTVGNTSLFFFNAKSNSLEEQKIELKDKAYNQSGKLLMQQNGTMQLCGFTTNNPKSWSDASATISGVYSVTINSPNAEPKSNVAINFSDSLRNAVNGKNKVKDKKEIPAPSQVDVFTIGKDILLFASDNISNTDTSSFKTQSQGTRIYSFSDNGRMNWVSSLPGWASADYTTNYLHAAPLFVKQPNSILCIYTEAAKTEKKWKDVYTSALVCKEIFSDGAVKQKTLLESENNDVALITLPSTCFRQDNGLAAILLGKNVFRPAFIHFK